MPISQLPKPTQDISALDVLQRFRLIIRTAQAHSAEIERQSGIPSSQVWVLLELHENGAMRAGELAARMALKPATLSNILAAMEELGLVERGRSEHDQRVVMVKLSAAGCDKTQHLPNAGRGWLPEALAKLQEPALLELADGLDALLAAMPPQDEADRYKPLPFAE